MNIPLRVLLVEDSEDDAKLLLRELQSGGYDPIFERVDTPEAMRAALGNKTWDVVLCDYVMPRFSGLDALELLQKSGLDLPFILVSGGIGEETAVEAMKAGAHDYIIKDHLARLVPAVRRELREAELRQLCRRAEQAMQEQMNLATLSAHVGLSLVQSASLPDMLQRSAEALSRHFDAALASIWTFDAEKDMLELQASAGIYTLSSSPHNRVPLGEFRIGKIAQERQPYLINSAVEDAPPAYRDWAEREGIMAFAGHPLVVGDRLVGVMAVFARKPLTEAALQAMAAVANDIALGIEHKEDEDSLIRLNRLYTVLSETNQAIVRVRDREKLLQEVCRVAVEHGLFRTAYISLVDAETTGAKPVAWCGIAEEDVVRIRTSLSAIAAEPLTPTKIALCEGKCSICNDIEHDQRKPAWRDRALERGYRSVAAFPLKSGQRVIGSFTVSSGEPHFFDDDEIRLLSELAADISYALESIEQQKKRQQAEEELRKGEELYRSLFESMLNGFAYCRMLFIEGRPQDFIYLEVNSAFEAQTGLKNVVGKKVSEVIPGIRESDPHLFEIYGRVALTGKPERFETYVAALGMWFSISVYSPRKEHFVAVFDVITERKRAEEQLRKLSYAVEQAPTIIVITDTRGNIEYVNPKFTQLTDYTSEEVIGKNPRILRTGATTSQQYRQLWDTITSGREWRGEFQNKKKDSTGYWEAATISPIKNPQGEITHFIKVAEDITERRKLEYQLRHAQKMEAIGVLAGGIAHDFNNMLTAIIGYGSLLQMQFKEGDPLRFHVDQILAAAERSANLTQSLLAFSRKQPISLRAVDLNEIIGKTAKLLLQVIGEDIQLETRLVAEQPLTIMADSGQIEQVLMNLATNARDAMPDGGLLSISTELIELNADFVNTHGYGQPGMYALVSVTDSGSGMDEETRAKIFEPFFTTKEVGRGTGLGLSIVYGIIKQHNGYVNVYSEPGRGTTFKIYLPMIAKSEIQEQKPAALAPAPGGMETVLLAEDEEQVRNLRKLELEEFGYKVIEAVDGEDAVGKYVEHKDRIGLVVLDVIMPKKNGKEAYEEMKRLRPDIKVLFTSGYTPDLMQKKGILEEGLAFVSKPASPSEFLGKVREVLDRG